MPATASSISSAGNATTVDWRIASNMAGLLGGSSTPRADTLRAGALNAWSIDRAGPGGGVRPRSAFVPQPSGGVASYPGRPLRPLEAVLGAFQPVDSTTPRCLLQLLGRR